MVKLTDFRIAWLVREVTKGRERVSFWAQRWGVTKRRLQQLVKEYRDTGEVPTLNPSRRPKAPPLLWDQVAAIVQERKQHPVGATELWHRPKAKGVHIPHEKIHRLYRQRRWTTPNPRKQKPRTRCRYEREHSGSLLHGDYHRTTENHPYVILWEDDASRRILSGGEFTNQTAEHAIATFNDALKAAAEWGLPIRQVNTDRGAQFYANAQTAKTDGTAQFEDHLARLGIEHVPSRVKNPQTNGKLERIWHEYDKHRWRFPTLQDYVEWTNDRPHSAHHYETPNQAFQRKLPPEVLLQLHERLIQTRRKPVTVEVLYAKN